MKNEIGAELIAHSALKSGEEVTSFICKFPRFILPEVNTHRMFSRNSASSRAIPFKKMLKTAEEEPFIPHLWQKKHKGMQGNEYWKKEDKIVGEPGVYDYYPKGVAISDWLNARDCAVTQAKHMNNSAKITKQLCNRLLEPFMWHTALITTSTLDNFFLLRCPRFEHPYDKVTHFSRRDFLMHQENCVPKEHSIHPSSLEEWFKLNKSQAEVHIQLLAESMWDEYAQSEPKVLKEGEWHIPFPGEFDIDEVLKVVDQDKHHMDIIPLKIAVARAARLSYNNFDGRQDFMKDIELHDRLLESGHMSPFEHVARAMTEEEYASFRKGHHDAEWLHNGETGSWHIDADAGESGWAYNLHGFIPYRWFVENNMEALRWG